MPPRRHRGLPPTGELRSITPSGVAGGRRPEKVCVQPASSSHRGLKMHPRTRAPPGLRAWRAQPSSGGLGQARRAAFLPRRLSCPRGSISLTGGPVHTGLLGRGHSRVTLCSRPLQPHQWSQTDICTHKQTHTHAHANTYTQVHTQGSQRHVHAHTCTERYVCNHRHTRVHTYTDAQIHTCAQPPRCACVHIGARTCTLMQQRRARRLREQRREGPDSGRKRDPVATDI